MEVEDAAGQDGGGVVNAVAAARRGVCAGRAGQGVGTVDVELLAGRERLAGVLGQSVDAVRVADINGAVTGTAVVPAAMASTAMPIMPLSPEFIWTIAPEAINVAGVADTRSDFRRFSGKCSWENLSVRSGGLNGWVWKRKIGGGQ